MPPPETFPTMTTRPPTGGHPLDQKGSTPEGESDDPGNDDG